MVALESLLLVCALGAGSDTLLLDFSAPWCGGCKVMEPTVHRLATDGYPVQQINIDQQPDLARRFGISHVPCFVLVSGGREVERISGPTGYSDLVRMFQHAGYTRPQAGGAGESETIRGQSPDRIGQRLRDRVGEMVGALRGGRGEPVETSTTAGARDVDVSFPEQSDGQTLPPIGQPSIGRPPSAAMPESDLDRRAVDPSLPRDRAQRATVRLTVKMQDFNDIATGTIIDTHGDEALIVTCGHVFRDSGGKGEITVEFCGIPNAPAVRGQLIAYDASQRDIGLVAIKPGVKVTPMPVAPAGFSLHERMSVFSVGCNHGGPASVVDSRISGVDRVLGPPNIEVSGEPVDGRSGGGLFTSDGLLIGICNCADHGSDEGIYAALPTIHEQLAQLGLQRLFEGRSVAARGAEAPRQLEPVEPARPLLPELPAATPVAAASFNAPANSGGAASGDVEVIFIVRPRDGRGQTNAITIKNPSRELLQMMQRESQHGETIVRAQSQQ